MTKNFKKHKIGLLALKYFPVIIAFIMWLNLIFMLHGYILPFTDIIAGSALIPSILIILISNMLEFCRIHKALTIYSLITDVWGTYCMYNNGSIFILIVNYIMIIVGLILFILLINNLCKGSSCGQIKQKYLKFIKRYAKF